MKRDQLVAIGYTAIAAALVWLVGVIERFTLKRMGVKP